MNQYYKELLENLEFGRPELPLMLKIVDYLRSIDSKIGNPINTFDIMVSQ